MATVFRATWPSFKSPGYVRVLWRALNWSEFRSVQARYGHLPMTLYSPMDLYMEVYEKIVLSGPRPEVVTAGIAAQVALHQLNNSPFSGNFDAVAHKLIEKRKWLSENYLESCRAIIAATFRVSFEEMDKWDAEQIFEKFVMAEYALGNQFNPADPRQLAADAEAKKRGARGAVAPGPPKSAREVAYMKAKARRQAADAAEVGTRTPAEPRRMPNQMPKPPDTTEFSWTK